MIDWRCKGRCQVWKPVQYRRSHNLESRSNAIIALKAEWHWHSTLYHSKAAWCFPFTFYLPFFNQQCHTSLVYLWWFVVYSVAFKRTPIGPFPPHVEWRIHSHKAFCIFLRQKKFSIHHVVTSKSGCCGNSYILSLGWEEILHLFPGWCYTTIYFQQSWCFRFYGAFSPPLLFTSEHSILSQVLEWTVAVEVIAFLSHHSKKIKKVICNAVVIVF